MLTGQRDGRSANWLKLGAMLAATPLLIAGCTASRGAVSGPSPTLGVPAPGAGAPEGVSTGGGADQLTPTASSTVPPAEDPRELPPDGSASTVVPWAEPSAEVRLAFERLRTRLPGTRLYVPSKLPAGTTVPTTWWPVSSGKSPAAWTGPSLPNPNVAGPDQDPQVSLVLQVGDRDVWIEVLQRIKGDLGDLPSRRAPLVAGRQAASYRLHGGDLVQWSDGGQWYGVYGRHLADGVTAEVAMGMVVAGE